jgi:hypothetical protein
MGEVKTISLTDSQSDIVLRSISLQQEELKAKLQELQDRYNDNQNIISQLLNGTPKSNRSNGFEPTVGSKNESKEKETSSNGDPVLLSYDRGASWWNKAIFVLKKRNKGTGGREILNFLYELDPELKGDEETQRKNGVNLFALLSTKVSKGKLRRIKTKNGDYLYGFPDWFNDDGRLKEIHR